MKALAWLCLWCVLSGSLGPEAHAGGSGLNVLLVVNQQSTNSVQLGNYYCEQRQVPPQNYLRMNWPVGNGIWSNSDFTTALYTPLLNYINSSGLSNQIDYVVLSMDIPYRITDPSSAADNSTTASVFYGFKPDANPPCSLAPGSTNLYAGSEGIFRQTPPISTSSNSFLVTMITASNLSQAMSIIDNGVMSDHSFPTQTVYLMKTTDPARNVRYQTFDSAIFNTRLRGNYSMLRTNINSPFGFSNLLGLQTGLMTFSISPDTFVPGAIADNLTSYGGGLLGYNDQTTLLAMIGANATASYGTVDEPCNYLEKFPSAEDYFYQARGFNIAESYYLSLTNPYQGLIVGEPLAAPFARPATGSWLGLATNALLRGVTNLSLQFTAADAQLPLQQVDLFLDGVWQQTLTNIAPGTSNLLKINLNGQSFNYLVPQNATIKSVTSNLVTVLNNSSNLTQVLASAHGDRIELDSLNRVKFGSQVPLSVSNSIGTGSALTTYLAASRSSFLDTVAQGIRGFTVEGSPTLNSALVVMLTKTNGAQITLGVTNAANNLTLTQMGQQLVSLINGSALLQGADGVTASDLVTDSTGPVPPPQIEFNIQANSAGWNAAEIQASLSGSPGLVATPLGTVVLDQNVTDLEPRAHLYLTAGVTNLPLTFSFNTTTQADGFHELTAVVYEGDHVRTQQRISQFIQISNTVLAATLTTLVGGSNTDVGTTLQFSVVANTGNISQIQLFSTGGLLGTVANQSSASFSVTGSFLGIGLHPFYAVVTSTTGQQYRTATTWIRLLGAEPPFRVSLTTPPPTLTWPATAGRAYDVLSTTNLSLPFQTNATVTPSNTTGLWIDTNALCAQRFYKVLSAP